MRLRPVGNVLSMRRIGAYPRLRKFIVIVRPLRHEVRIALKAILLKPRLDIRCYELALFGAASISDNRSEHPRDAIAQ